MFTRPDDIDERDLLAALRDVWDVDATDVEYEPVGFGSHHWRVRGPNTRWFATVDDLSARVESDEDTTDLAFSRLERAFATASVLARDDQLEFVVAPLLTRDGSVLHRLDARYSVVLHPFVDGRSPASGDNFESPNARNAVVDLLPRLHESTELVSDVALTDRLNIPGRDRLVAALDAADEPWTSGPYAERARALLTTHAGSIAGVLPVYDELAATSLANTDRMVITHGEPHAQNVLESDGRYQLIDWESCLIAVPERDLRGIDPGDGSVFTRYASISGRRVDLQAARTWSLWYDLFEIAGYIDFFRHPHGETLDAAESWKNLQYFLRPHERWADLL